MRVRQSYDDDLQKLANDIKEMGESAENAISRAMDSLVFQDVELAEEILRQDDWIDKKEREIEEACILLIARQQPLAGDLRIIVTGMKIITDLERMGDHACNIARTTLEMADQPLIKPLVDLPRMAELAKSMIRQALQAYLHLDAPQAKAVIQADAEVDHLYKQVFRELLLLMIEDPKKITQGTQLLFIGRYLERIADHATNIAQWTGYLTTGTRFEKHEGEED